MPEEPQVNEPQSEVTQPPVPARRATDLPPDAPWWAKWFVANISEAWRWFSVQVPLWCGVAIEFWGANAEEVYQHVPKEWTPHIIAGLFWLTMGMRLINQKPKEKT